MHLLELDLSSMAILSVSVMNHPYASLFYRVEESTLLCDERAGDVLLGIIGLKYLIHPVEGFLLWVSFIPRPLTCLNRISQSSDG
jgi:hypothetical protein